MAGFRAASVAVSAEKGVEFTDIIAKAYEKGVKIMGATAHYITEELDAGPIIEQTVERVDHSQSPGELELIGQDIESITLTRAVKKHLEGKVFINDKKNLFFILGSDDQSIPSIIWVFRL